MASKFLNEVLPRQIAELQDKRKKLEWEQRDAVQALEYGDHDCDCEYCEYNDYAPLYGKELDDAEKAIEDRKQEIADMTIAINRAIAYKEFMESKNAKIVD